MAAVDLATGHGFLRRHDARHSRRVAGILVDGEQLCVERYVMGHRGRKAYQWGDHRPIFSLSHTSTVARFAALLVEESGSRPDTAGYAVSGSRSPRRRCSLW